MYHALDTLVALLDYADDVDHEMANGAFIHRGKRMCSVAQRNAKGAPEDYALLFTEVICNRLDSLWTALQQFYMPSPINKDGSLADLRRTCIEAMNTKGRNANSILPSADTETIRTRDATWRLIMKDVSRRYPGEDDMWDVSTLRQAIDMIVQQARFYGHAMREHNNKYIDDKIVLDDVLRATTSTLNLIDVLIRYKTNGTTIE